MNRYFTIVAATALLVTASAFAQSTPETAAPAGPSIAPITGSSTVGQPGTLTTPAAHYHHIIHRVVHHKHHRMHHAKSTSTTTGAPPPQDSTAGTPSPH